MMILSVKVFKIVLNQKTIFFNARRQMFFERKNVEIEGQLCESFLNCNMENETRELFL